MSPERAPLPLPPAFWQELRRAYAEPPRAYHGWSHVEDVASWFERVEREVGWREPREVFLAILFHDAIYQAGARDNEARSARLAREVTGRHLPAAGIDVARVEALILLTARHGQLDRGEVDDEAAQMLDCDMAILGAEPEAFARYDAQIAAEHAHLPVEAYRAGRRRFLESLLARRRIYLSPWFEARLEAPARANLERALAGMP